MKKGDTLNVPKGWEIKKLGEVLKLEYGKPLPDEKRIVGGNFPIYGANGLKGRSNVFYYDRKTIIVGRKGSAGEINLTEEKFWPLDVTYFATFDEKKYDLLFLFHLLTLLNLPKLAKGVKPGINRNEVYNLNVSIPTLPEQHRIVSILDECFTAIDKAKTNAEQNLKNAKELFESYLQGVFEKKGEGWEEKPLKELTTKIGSGATPRGGQENYKDEGISLVRSMNVHDWEFREINLAFIDEKQAKELDGVILQENDVLLNITGASVARCCVFPKDYLPARVNQHVSIIRPKKEILDARFLNLLLTSKPYKDQLLFTGEQGATRQAITKAQIETFRISFPKLSEQQTIVRQLDALRVETQKLESVYQKKIADLEDLKKSVLQRTLSGVEGKAFAGELTEKIVVA